MIFAAAMRKSKSHRRPPTDEERDYVKKLALQILDRATNLKIPRQVVGERAGRGSASTLYGYRNGGTPNPSLLELRAYAKAVGLDLCLIDATHGSVGNSTHSRGDNLTAEQAEVLRLMDGASDDLQRAIRDAAHSVMKKHLNPLEASVEQSGPHVRK